MSRVGQKPVEIPSGVTVKVLGNVVSAKGPQGELQLPMPRGITAVVEGGRVTLTRADDNKPTKCLHGLARSLTANLVDGVAKGYRKDLEIQGTGFKAAVQGQILTLSLGFSAPVKYDIPAGIKIAVEAGTQLAITGPDKQKVGDVAARIKSYYPAEPYKGKGVRFKGEHIRRKVGKTVA